MTDRLLDATAATCMLRTLLVNEIWHCRRRRYCCSNRKWVLLRKKSDSNTICMSRTHSIWQIASISDPDRDRKRRTNLAVTLFDFSSLKRYTYSDSNLNSPFKTVKISIIFKIWWSCNHVQKIDRFLLKVAILSISCLHRKMSSWKLCL